MAVTTGAGRDCAADLAESRRWDDGMLLVIALRGVRLAMERWPAALLLLLVAICGLRVSDVNVVDINH